jgi:hypothetical protein
MQKKLKAHGEFPDGHVFKAFSRIEHADAFVGQGRFRMGSLKSYRKTEDVRRKDDAEGHGHIWVPGAVVTAHFDAKDPDYFEVTEGPGHRDVHSELGNPIYIFSTSLPEVDLDYLKNRFGRFIIQIDAPEQLAHDITEHLKRRPEKFAGGIEGCMVSYNRDGIVDADLDNYKLISLSYSQKSADFVDEYEFRFVAINMDRPSERRAFEYLEIDLGGPVSYARVISI